MRRPSSLVRCLLSAALTIGSLGVGVAAVEAEEIDLEWLTTTTIGSSDSQALALVVQPDGKFVVAGYSVKFGTTREFMLARFDTDGTLDPTFGIGGVSVPTIDNNWRMIFDMKLDSSGRFVVAGKDSTGVDSYGAVARFRADGSLDTTFNAGGATPGYLKIDSTGSEDSLRSLALTSDGHIVAVGLTYVGNDSNALLARIAPNGTLDATFDNDGIVLQPLPNGQDVPQSIAVDADGRYVVAGVFQTGVSRDIGVSRYLPSGILDQNFGTQGRTTIAMGQDSSHADQVLFQGNGRIVVIGATDLVFPNTLVVTRLLADGSLDPSFGTAGIATAGLGSQHQFLTGGFIQSDGRILVVGSAQKPVSDYDFLVARFNGDGSLDTSFGSGGFRVHDSGGDQEYLRGVTVLSDGSIVAAGSRTDGNRFDTAVLRFRARPIPVPVWRATFDPAGGTCLDSTPRTATWTSVFVGYRYLPDATDCTKADHVFVGWNDTTTGEPAHLPLLTDPTTGTRRHFLAADASLTASWRPLPTAITDLVVFANFLCGPCSNAWLLHPPSEHATDYDYTVNTTPVSCATDIEVFGLRACELTGLPAGSPLSVAVTPRNSDHTGPISRTTFLLRP